MYTKTMYTNTWSRYKATSDCFENSNSPLKGVGYFIPKLAVAAIASFYVHYGVHLDLHRQTALQTRLATNT